MDFVSHVWFSLDTIVILCLPKPKWCCLFMCALKMLNFTNIKLYFSQLNYFSCLLPQYSVPRRLFCFYTRQGNLVSSCVYWMCSIWQIWYCTCCNLIAFVSFVWLPMYNIKLHLLQKNCIPFMCLAPSIQLPKQSDSVSTRAATLLWIYRRLIGRSYITFARQDQYIGNISDPLGRLKFWLFWYLFAVLLCICKHS